MAKRGASTDLQIFGSEKVLFKSFSITFISKMYNNYGYQDVYNTNNTL